MSSKKPVAEDIDCLVVGGGPAGIYALKFLSDAQAGATEIGLVESGSSLGGRAKSALHLIDSDLSSPFPILTGTLLGPPVVRWERNWVPMDKVNWSDKDWIGRLPQWDLLAPGLKMLLMEVSIPELGENAFMKVQSPVSRLSELEDGRWEVVTPDVTYTSKRVIWAAGMKPFQNAFGKQEAQAHLVANPNYSSVAADFRGGVALDIEVPRNVVWEEGFNSEGIFGLPVRFEGKLHL
ncbi:MAG: NAD(P)-binding protein, partial [Bdellovibrionota bacterium]